MFDFKANSERIIAKLRDPIELEGLKSILDSSRFIEKNNWKNGSFLLNEFFRNNPSPVDIVMILYSSLFYTLSLSYHIEENNLLLFRPKSSYKSRIEYSFLNGKIHPHRTLLLFDDVIDKGCAMEETMKYFINLGYSKENIFGYVHKGFRRLQNSPQLMSVNDLLKIPKEANVDV